MNDLIKYHYNLECNNLIEKEDHFSFVAGDNNFLLYPFLRSNEELQDLYQICEEMKKMNIPVHTFILNRENKLITNIYEKNYVLLKIEENKSKEYNILDMIELVNILHPNRVKSNLYRNQWEQLWSGKIDYFEYQVHELGKDKNLILNSFTYYVGLAENAISYVNQAMKKNGNTPYKITLSHKRINFPNYVEEYLNPLTFIFDLNVRDISEYIKSAFFQDEQEAWTELKAFLSIKGYSIFDYEMFYGRLLYPSYYFDIYEKVMDKKEEEEKLLPYIKKAPLYEDFLKKVYYEIIKIAPIDKVDWILEKKL